MDAKRMDIVTERSQAKLPPKPENHGLLRPMREVCVLQPWPAPSQTTPVQPKRACVLINGAPLEASVPAPCTACPAPCQTSDLQWQSPEPQDIPPATVLRQTAQEAVPPLAQPLPVPARRPSANMPQTPQTYTAKGKLLVSPETVIEQKRDALEQRWVIRTFMLKLVVIAAVSCLLVTQVFGFAVMTGEQMYPRIRDGDLMLYYRLTSDYSIGDVLTFVRDGVRYTGRVVARGGDAVSMNDSGQLLVNDNVQTEEIFYPTTAAETEPIHFPLAIPERSYFLLCDMRTQATDSRVYGAVSQNEIEGKVISVLRRSGI